jgi:hypothetical protein
LSLQAVPGTDPAKASTPIAAFGRQISLGFFKM